jgi:hypothetical protein
MYSSNNMSLGNETMGSHSKTVIGILVITVIVMIGLSLLGVSNNVVAKNDIQEPELPFDTATSWTSDEPVPEGLKDELGPFDTARGTMDIVYEESSLPTGCEILPLCLDQSFFDQFWIVVETTGGYHFECGTLYVYQGEGDKRELRGTVMIKTADLDYPQPAHCCIPKKVKLVFEVCGTICLDSNHVPDLSGSDFWVCPDKTLDKEVFFDLCSTWSGCYLEDQEFQVILAHKAMSQNPILPIYTSPVRM